jgi:hypothetical protein
MRRVPITVAAAAMLAARAAGTVSSAGQPAAGTPVGLRQRDLRAPASWGLTRALAPSAFRARPRPAAAAGRFAATAR